MSLLSSNDKTKIRNAIKLVTDTFMVNSIEYFFCVESVDVFQEDRKDIIYKRIVLKGLVEPDTNTNDIEESIDGAHDFNTIIVTFNLEDLQALGLITNDFNYKFNPTKDYIKDKGLLYKITDIKMDGPLDSKNILVVLKCFLTKNETITNFTTITSGSGL